MPCGHLDYLFVGPASRVLFARATNYPRGRISGAEPPVRLHVPRDPGVDVAHPLGRHEQGPRHGLPAHRARAGGQEKVRLLLRHQVEFAQRGKCGGSSGQGDPVEAHGTSHRYRGKHTDLQMDPTDLAPQVLDARGAKVPADSEAVGSLPHKVSMSTIVRNVHPFHQVLIMSEEQFKIFSLPALNPTGKYKVTQSIFDGIMLCILLTLSC